MNFADWSYEPARPDSPSLVSQGGSQLYSAVSLGDDGNP